MLNQGATLTLTRSEIECCCVYVFWLGKRCQYVGASKVGLSRPLSATHVAQTEFSYDRLEVFKQSDIETALELESRWIRDLCPQYNIRGIGSRRKAAHTKKDKTGKFIADPSRFKLFKKRDDTTGEYLVVSNTGTELYRSNEAYLRDRFLRSECKRLSDERMRVSAEALKREARDNEANFNSF